MKNTGTKRPKPRRFKLNLRGLAGCGVCDSSADFITPVDGINVDLTVQQGGFCALAILKKSDPFTDPNDDAEWATKITAGDLRVLMGCYQQGDIVDNSATEALGSCERPALSKSEWLATFVDIEDNVSHDRYAFWEKVRANANCYQVAFINSDGTIQGFVDASILPKFNTGATKSDKRSWNVEITFYKLPPFLTLTYDVLDPAIAGLAQ